MRGGLESHLAYLWLIWLGRQMKHKVEKKNPEESGCSGNYWLLKCIERWISCLVGIIRQVLSGNRSESRRCGLCIMTLSNEADWSRCQESDWPWPCFFVLSQQDRKWMSCWTEERRRCEAPETVWSDFIQCLAPWKQRAEADLIAEKGIKCKCAPYQGESDIQIST